MHDSAAIFVGSKTGQDDAPFVFIKIGDEKRRMRGSEWDALPLGRVPVLHGLASKPRYSGLMRGDHRFGDDQKCHDRSRVPDHRTHQAIVANIAQTIVMLVK